ncbi:hypothetical protein [Scytonema sp. PRP1]|uniref:hypothetical protein n=1 Tax=Scytonema sp. PRP1 TaxID=3120513 RepID=UPI002FD310E0
MEQQTRVQGDRAYRRKAEGRGQRAEGKIVSFNTKAGSMCSARWSKAPEFIYGDK